MTKRAWLLSTLAFAATGAMAQSAVQVYGIVDAGVTRVTGVKGGTVTRLSSGIMEGSRVGFKGNEDLGGGYRALFTMEHRFEADTGDIVNRPGSGSQLPDRLSTSAGLGLALPAALAPVGAAAVAGVASSLGGTVGVNLPGTAGASRFWDRQVYVGLVTPVGAVLAGRQYTPAYEISAGFDTLNTQSGLAAGQVASFPTAIDIRVSNAVAYRIQKGPISGAFMYGLGEGSTSTGRLIGVNAMYKTEAFAVGVGYNTRKNELGQKSLTSVVIGASAAIGPGTLFGEVATSKDDHPTGTSTIAASVSALLAGNPATAALPLAARTTVANAVQAGYTNGLKQDSQLMHVGYRLVSGPNTVYVAYSRINDKLASNADTASYGVAYSYSFSKRTDLNVVGVRFNNNKNGQLAPGGNGYLGGFTATAGTDSTGLALGLRHRF